MPASASRSTTGRIRRDSGAATPSPRREAHPAPTTSLLREQLLDSYGIDYAILTGEDILTVSAMPSPQLAAALAPCLQRLAAEHWLTLDPRLKGSIVVATQDPAGAAAEIRRAGGTPDVVQVLLPTGARAGYGDPQYRPIFEAAEEVGIVVGIHVGADGCGTMGAPTRDRLADLLPRVAHAARDRP